MAELTAVTVILDAVPEGFAGAAIDPLAPGIVSYRGDDAPARLAVLPHEFKADAARGANHQEGSHGL